MLKKSRLYQNITEILDIPLGTGEKLLINKIIKENNSIIEKDIFVLLCEMFKNMGYENKKMNDYTDRIKENEKEIYLMWNE